MFPRAFRPRLWPQDKHPIEMKEPKHHHDTLDYLPVRPAGIHTNPVHAGFVEKPKDYLYSSAKDYYELKGMIE